MFTEVKGAVSRARIILIEDEAIVAMDIEEMLQQAGFKVVGVAPSFTRAFAILSERPANLILLDSDTNDARAGLPWFGLPVVLMTSSSSVNLGALPLAHRCACASVTKPFLVSRLLAAVECVLRQQPGGKAATSTKLSSGRTRQELRSTH